jgi:hypothetical protein
MTEQEEPVQEERQITKEPVPIELKKPKAMIIDIDGTLMSNVRRTSLGVPFVKYENEINMLHMDKTIDGVAGLINIYCRMVGVIPIFVTGRMDNFNGRIKSITIEQIMDALPVVKQPILFMRGENDFRKPVEFKNSVYKEHIRPNYDVVMVIDDDNDVCEHFSNIHNILSLQPYFVEKEVKE